MRVIFFLLLFFICTFVQANGVSGWITEVSGSEQNLQLNRHDQTIPLKPFVELYQGDVIHVKKEGDFVRLKLSDGEVLVNTENSPFQLAKSYQKASFASNMQEWVLSYFKINNPKYAKTIAAVSRGKGLQFPLIPEGLAKIKQRDAIALVWAGGSAPYELLIKNPKGKKILTLRDIQTTHVKVASAGWPLGRYTVHVSGGGGQSAALIDFGGLDSAACLQAAEKNLEISDKEVEQIAGKSAENIHFLSVSDYSNCLSTSFYAPEMLLEALQYSAFSL